MSKRGSWGWWKGLRLSHMRLRSLGLFRLEKSLRRDFIAVTTSSWEEVEGKTLISPLWWSWSCVRKSKGRIPGRGFSPWRWSSIWTGSPGKWSLHLVSLTELRKSLHNASSTWCDSWDALCRTGEGLCGSPPTSTFCDSVILYYI